LKEKLKVNKILKVLFVIILFGYYGCTSSGIIIENVNEPIDVNKNGLNQINLITYNIQDVFGKGQTELDALVNYLNREEYDFVLLQELFNESTRDYLLSNIDTAKYGYIIPRIDYDSFPEFLFNDAGLFYMSRFPYVDLSRIQFENGIENRGNAIHKLLKKEISLSTDFLANKSIAGSLFKINDSTKIFLCSTHVQAIGSKHQKNTQLRQIRRFIEQAVYHLLVSGTVKKSDNLVVMLAGDFNSDAYNPEKFEMMQTYLGNPRDIHSELNIDKRDYTFKLRFLNRFLRFDYIFAYDNLGNIPLRKIKVHSINATDIRDENDESISDHLAIKASIIVD
jgi:endonuclease/exonuclease/phosphatase family metal-dependent hydrolase